MQQQEPHQRSGSCAASSCTSVLQTAAPAQQLLHGGVDVAGRPALHALHAPALQFLAVCGLALQGSRVVGVLVLAVLPGN